MHGRCVRHAPALAGGARLSPQPRRDCRMTPLPGPRGPRLLDLMEQW
jgi:hypothetical protein